MVARQRAPVGEEGVVVGRDGKRHRPKAPPLQGPIYECCWTDFNDPRDLSLAAAAGAKKKKGVYYEFESKATEREKEIEESNSAAAAAAAAVAAADRLRWWERRHPPSSFHGMWDLKPAADWTDAYPVGNGVRIRTVTMIEI